MATYDQSGTVVYPTADPNIVKEFVPDGSPIPVYNGESVRADPNAGGSWVYYPTQAALAAGKIMAAVDTINALPDQIAQQVTDVAAAARQAVSSVPTVLIVAAGLFLAAEIFMRKAGR